MRSLPHFFSSAYLMVSSLLSLQAQLRGLFPEATRNVLGDDRLRAGVKFWVFWLLTALLGSLYVPYWENRDEAFTYYSMGPASAHSVHVSG
jgi:hypothetical protein